MPDGMDSRSPMEKGSPEFAEDRTQINSLNNKLLFDAFLQKLTAQSALPNAWEVLAQRIANDHATLSIRVANNNAAFDHAVSMGSVLAAQAGVTESQQTVSPIKLGAGDSQNQQPAGAVYPPIRNVDQGASVATNGVMAAQEQIAANIAALSDVVTKLSDALAAVVVTAAGGASTPSQTQAKPTA